MAHDQGRRPATLVLDAREVVYRIRRVRRIDGRAVLYVEHYLNPVFFPAILQQDLTASLTELYANRYDIRYGNVRFDMCPTTFPAVAIACLKRVRQLAGPPVRRSGATVHRQIYAGDKTGVIAGQKHPSRRRPRWLPRRAPWRYADVNYRRCRLQPPLSSRSWPGWDTRNLPVRHRPHGRIKRNHTAPGGRSAKASATIVTLLRQPIENH